MIQTLANAIGTGAVGELANAIGTGAVGELANLKTPDKGSGLMFNPDTGKLYIPCGNGVTVNKNTGMLEVPIGDNLRYTSNGLDVPDADETTAGVVKLTHEVSNRDDGEWAVTADGVYAYCPAKGMAAEMPAAGDYLTSTVFTRVGDGRVSLTKNGQLCVTGITVFRADVPINTPANTLAFDNALKIRIPCLAFWGPKGDAIHTEITFIDEDGFLNSNVAAPVESKLQIIITPGIYPIFANKE